MTRIECQISVTDITSVADYFLIPSITIPIPLINSNLIGLLISKHDLFGIKMLFLQSDLQMMTMWSIHSSKSSII